MNVNLSTRNGYLEKELISVKNNFDNFVNNRVLESFLNCSHF